MYVSGASMYNIKTLLYPMFHEILIRIFMVTVWWVFQLTQRFNFLNTYDLFVVISVVKPLHYMINEMIKLIKLF